MPIINPKNSFQHTTSKTLNNTKYYQQPESWIVNESNPKVNFTILFFKPGIISTDIFSYHFKAFFQI